jgi:hypothetical protein
LRTELRDIYFLRIHALILADLGLSIELGQLLIDCGVAITRVLHRLELYRLVVGPDHLHGIALGLLLHHLVGLLLIHHAVELSLQLLLLHVLGWHSCLLKLVHPLNLASTGLHLLLLGQQLLH